MPLCEGCGSSFEDTFNFCPSCGRAKPEPNKINIEVDIKQKHTHDDCPICGDGANVQKVSAIVASGTSEANGSSTTLGNSKIYNSSNGKQLGESYSTGTIHSSSIQQNKLAEYLTKPKPPIKPFSSKWSPGCWSIGILAFLIYLIMYGIADSLRVYSTGGVIVIVIIGIVFLIFGTEGVTSLVNNQNNSKEKDQKAEEYYKSALSDYQVALPVWDSLYYCHKHDIVFLIGNKDYVPKEDMWKACIRWGKDKVASS